MDIRYVLARCSDMTLGDSRKYPWPYMYMDGFSEFWGQGGFFELEILEHWGVLTTGILKAWRGFRSGISTGERWECIPWKRLFYWLNQFANKARTDNTAAMAMKDISIHWSVISVVFIGREKPTKSGFYIKLQKNMLQNILFFSQENSLIKLIILPIWCQTWSFDRGRHLKFQTPKAQIQDGGNKNIHTCNIFQAYKRSPQDILMFCTKLGQM